jgi:hypothetical protein
MKFHKFVTTKERSKSIYTNNPLGFFYRRSSWQIKIVHFSYSRQNSNLLTNIDIFYTNGKFLRLSVWGKYLDITNCFLSKKQFKDLVLIYVTEGFKTYTKV